MNEERLNYYKEWIEENEEIVVDSSIFKELVDEIKRLNNIINRMEEDLKEMYITFGEFNEEYTEKKIRELKEGK